MPEENQVQSRRPSLFTENNSTIQTFQMTSKAPCLHSWEIHIKDKLQNFFILLHIFYSFKPNKVNFFSGWSVIDHCVRSKFFFFFYTLSSLLLRIYYHQMLSFQESVGHISCTIWSSPQLSTYEFSFIVGLLVISCFSPGVHVALGQLPVPLGGRGNIDTFGAWRPLQVKIIVLGQDI